MSTELQARPRAFERPREPQQIGKYRVLAKLGEGATSEVFMCRDDFAERDVSGQFSYKKTWTLIVPPDVVSGR